MRFNYVDSKSSSLICMSVFAMTIRVHLAQALIWTVWSYPLCKWVSQDQFEATVNIRRIVVWTLYKSKGNNWSVCKNMTTGCKEMAQITNCHHQINQSLLQIFNKLDLESNLGHQCSLMMKMQLVGDRIVDTSFVTDATKMHWSLLLVATQLTMQRRTAVCLPLWSLFQLISKSKVNPWACL